MPVAAAVLCRFLIDCRFHHIVSGMHIRPIFIPFSSFYFKINVAKVRAVL